MKIIPFNIPKIRTEAVRVQIDDAPHLYDNLHRHREIQITTIVESEGTLIAGDYVGRFGVGDVFVMGSNLPHVFLNDAQYYKPGSGLRALAFSLFFDRDYMGEAFWNLDETRDVLDFLNTSAGGYRAVGATRVQTVELLRAIIHAHGAEKLVIFFQILQTLSTSSELLRLALLPVTTYSDTEGHRMNDILRFTLRESRRAISTAEVAEVAHLTPEAFCRYFKQRTRKTYNQYVNEIRVSNACNLLLQNDIPISAACEESGFHNLSHFNRIFKRVTGKTPSQYIRLAHEELHKK